MPPLRLTSLVHGALTNLSVTSRAVLSTLACRNGHAPPAGEVAAWVGLRDRFQLARVLRADGLPPLEQLAGWVRVLYWVLESEANGASLLELMQREHVDPATGYRLVRRVTGMRWSQVREAGVSVILLKLRDRCTERIVGARHRVEQISRLEQAVGDGVVHRATAARADLRLSAAPPRPRHPDGVIAERLPVHGSPFDVAITSVREAWVTLPHAAAVACFDLEARAPRRLNRIRTGPVPTRLVFAPAGDVGYVTTQFSDQVGILDVARHVQTGRIAVPGNPLAAALAPGGRMLYVTTNLDRLCAIELPHGRVAAAVPIPHAGFDLVPHPSGRWIYVGTWRTGTVLEVDTQTLCTTRTFALGGTVQDMVIPSDGVTLYSANEHGWLDAINLSTGKRATPLSLKAGAVSMALSPDECTLFVGLVSSGQIAMVERDTLRVAGTVDTGGRPRRITFDPSGGIALVANEAGWVDLVR